MYLYSQRAIELHFINSDDVRLLKKDLNKSKTEIQTIFSDKHNETRNLQHNLKIKRSSIWKFKKFSQTTLDNRGNTNEICGVLRK